MMNKKGIIRILEASAAILIIFIVVLTFSTTRKISRETDLSERITPLLEEIAKNNTMRDEIVNYDPDGSPKDIRANSSINSFLDSRVNNLGHDFKICSVGEVCGMDSYPDDITGNVYAGSRIISSSIYDSTSKRVSVFLWFNK